MMRKGLKTTAKLPRAVLARIRMNGPRGPRFAGAYSSRAAALATLPDRQKAGYDDASIANVSFDWMTRRASWDYPVLYWLKTLAVDGSQILDAGGHLGTKYIAFSSVWDMNLIRWTVYDMPQIIGVARDRQNQGQLPAAIKFIDDIGAAAPTDILIASGLVQYLDEPFEGFIDRLSPRPKYIILNKVPLWQREGLVTLERIGSARVPYQIRSSFAWKAEIDRMGYDIVDQWSIDSLSHEIATHPWLPKNESRGFVLRNRSM